jgi:dipeptidyl aminopeptidase/acylaminoacyl peptidase
MVALIPRSVLFGNPERLQPRLSPEGGRLAWIGPDDGVLNVWVAPIAAGGDAGGVDWASAQVVTNDRERGIRAYAWAHDRRHLLYLQDIGGDEDWQLFDVDLGTGEHRALTPFAGVHAQLVAVDQHHPDHVLVALNRDDPRHHDVYRLDLSDGSLEKVADNPGFLDLVADATLTVRAALAPEPDGGFRIVVRDSPTDEWRTLLEIPHEDAIPSGPLAFGADGTTLLAITSVGAETGRLLRLPLSGDEGEVLAEDPSADVTGVFVHPETKAPRIVTFLKDRAEYHVLDPDVAEDLAAVRALHPGDAQFEGGDAGDARWLVSFTNDAGPVPYFVYDRSTRRGSFLFDHQPALARYELAAMEPFSFDARDGLDIHGYVSFPPGAPRRDRPAVLLVHGGPWARDVWGHDPTAQWLANRGYLCVQVNFRGSTGYGKSFLNAGDREWGGRMHDDLMDAVADVVRRGWADADRVGIFGGSYGGYAALVGAAFTPDLFRCAVDAVGPSNLRTLIETIPPYWAPQLAELHRRVGDPATDAEFLWSRSPLSRVRDIRIPLLIAQGANDPRVKRAEAEQIVAALTEAGIDHEYLLFEDEGHGFAKPENRLRFYAAAERFLARHLGGRAED